MRNILFVAMLFPFCCALFSPAFGQTQTRDSVTGYPPAYFAGSSPASALEMVQLLPGFRLQAGDANVRGYSGSLGNVLIDGLPPASKEDSLETILQRIPQASVLQIELIRPGAAGIDMHGYALLANVVRRPDNAPHGQVQADDFYFPGYGMHAPKLTGQVSMGSTQVLDLTGSIYRMVDETRGGVGTRNRYALNGTPIYQSDIWQKRHEEDWTVSGVYRQPLLGGSVNLSGLYKSIRAFDDPLEFLRLPPTGYSLGRNRDYTSASEFSLQYRHPLWVGGEAELISVRRGGNEFASQTSPSAAGLSTSVQRTYTAESILRGAVRDHGDTLSLEGGVESAINTLNNNLAFVFIGTPVALPGADVHISEWRTEYFGTATWQALSNLTVEAGLRYEMTHLKQQSGGIALTKDFYYLKPRALVSWKPTGADELRLSYERIAGQLDFINFIPMINLTSNTITAGNVNLVPETKWRTEASWEHRLTGGSLVFTARHEALKNVVDRVPVFAPSGTFDGVGNIGSGHRDEYQVDFLRALDDLGLDGVTLQGSYVRRISRVTDPTTGKKRDITNDYPIEAKVSLTQDLPALKMRWGATFNHAKRRNTYRFNEERLDAYPESFDLFVEYKPQTQWLLRLSGHNVLDRPIYHSRDLYSGPRNTAPFNFREIRPALVGASVGMTVQRTF